ncbi:MAG: haloacid dehalogenase-like hydrolase [Firmicutes bacterium]|nr:haloacid dehalogenase-like hydrolase [Bacillota bacterium]
MKRILEACASDFRQMSPAELLQAIRLGEGRTLVAETVCIAPPLVDGLTNAELAAAFGADLVLLNAYDVQNPLITGLVPATPAELKRLIGRPVGINLEPSDSPSVTPGRRATAANAEAAAGQGVDFVVITGNPNTGVTNQAIAGALRAIKNRVGGRLFLAAGKMHGAGVVDEPGALLVDEKTLEEFVTAGADVILVPAPGTVPGMTVEVARAMVSRAHRLGALAMTAIGTSQEGADEGTIRRIAIDSKSTGADIHHIGDAGFSGVAVPENILAYSIAIKGRRHTYRRMGLSPLR